MRPAPPPSVAFGRRVRDLRHERGWTLRALGQLAGIHQSSVGRIERGERDVLLHTILRLSKAFGVDAGVLLAVPPKASRPRQVTASTTAGQER